MVSSRSHVDILRVICLVADHMLLVDILRVLCLVADHMLAFVYSDHGMQYLF